MTKPFNIPKKLVSEAYLWVKANKGAAGVDQQSLTEFEQNPKNNLYKLWNRLSSGARGLTGFMYVISDNAKYIGLLRTSPP